jgi:hydrogenase expression/formation protein HypC
MCLAVPGQLLSVEGDDPLTRRGRVSFAGLVKSANLAYVPDAKLGDYVLIHAGFAIAVIDEGEAQRTLAYLAELPPEDEA